MNINNQLYDYNIEFLILSTFFFETSKDPTLINAELFAHPILKQIFETLQLFWLKDIPIDENLVKKHMLRTHNNIQKELLEDIILHILSANPVANLQYYIEILKEYRKKREIKSALLSLSQGLNENKNSDELEAELLSYVEKMTYEQSNSLFSEQAASSLIAKESEFITKNFIPVPKNTVSIFSAGGGTGKTSLLLQLAMHFLDENKDKRAFCWLSEDPLSLTKYRLDKLISGLYSKGKETLDRLILSDSLTFPVLMDNNRSVKINASFYKMKQMLKNYDLIIWDPLIAFYGGDENNNTHAKLFMQLFTKWASKEDKTLIFIHHSTKNTSQSRGASAFVDAARAVYEVEKIKDNDGKEKNTTKRKVTLTKDNYRASKYFGGFTKEIQVFPEEEQTSKAAYEVEYQHFNEIDEYEIT